MPGSLAVAALRNRPVFRSLGVYLPRTDDGAGEEDDDFTVIIKALKESIRRTKPQAEKSAPGGDRRGGTRL